MRKLSQFKDGINEYKNIKFDLKRKAKISLSIKLNSKNEIIVSIPLQINDHVLLEFLDKNLERFNGYIIEKQNKKWINENEKCFYLFGEKNYFTVDEINKKIIINEIKKISFKNKSVEEVINSFRKKELQVYILIRQLQFQKTMGIEDHGIKIRQKNSAWATNHVQKKIIYYATNLSSFSKEIIDYVIIHELAHNKFPNHSSSFWKLVQKYDPNFKTKKYKLRKTIYY
ncbi:MAG: M48 family metallopeptidase [Mycoplasma sp.]|nr:M48 family metallopeptidase [Mycoplasma sp.]